jgi:predicted nucleic acid-binding protein
MRMVLVDTNIWSSFFRRKAHDDAVLQRNVFELIESGSVKIIGPIRQEILCGIRDRTAFEMLRSNISAFPDETITTKDYEDAAQLQNSCAAKGVASSSIDALIVAVASNRNWCIYTRDKDFLRYKQVHDFVLYDEVD